MLYFMMSPKVARMTVELARKETEMNLLGQQRKVEQQQAEERFSEQLRLQREQSADQLRAQREQSVEDQLRAQREQSVEQLRAQREQFDEQLKTTKEQLHVMARQLMDAQAQRLKEENREQMGTITQPLKDAITEMRKAISDNTKDHTEQTASLKEQLRLMMETGREMSEKAEGLANVLRRDNKVRHTL